MKKLLILLFSVLFISLTFSQTTFQIGNQSLEKHEDTWFIKDSGREYKVNTRSVTVKLKEGASIPSDIIESLNLAFKEPNKLGFLDIGLPEKSNFLNVIGELNATGLFEIVEINGFGELHSNDPGFIYQYNLNNSLGYPRIFVDDSNVWFWENGSTNRQIVALIDEGVDQGHLDLITNLTSDYDYFGMDTDPTPDNLLPNYDETHGTAVAGIIGAITNNGYAIAGIAGGYQSSGQYGTKIMSLRIIRGSYDPLYRWHSEFKTENIDDAIIHAADNGARIINMSFGVPQSAAIDAAINYAYRIKGCLLVASAGQDPKTNVISYPSSHTYVMSVGGVDETGDSYGDYIGGLDLVAPAVNVYSLRNSFSGVMGNFGGTSASAPQVSGVAALTLSNSPSLLHIDVWNLINQTATYLGPTYFGKGLLYGRGPLEWLDSPSSYINTPTNVTITKIVGTHPIIYWNPVVDATGYKIYRVNSIDGRYGFTEVASLTSTATNWTDVSTTVMDPRTAPSTNYYRVAAFNDNWHSILSSEVSCGSNMASKEGTDEKIVSSYELLGNYPNPFNPTTTIKFILEEPSFVKLEVFNSVGERVKELINSEVGLGTHEVSFDASNLPSGMYIYRLSVPGKFIKTNKMMLLK